MFSRVFSIVIILALAIAFIPAMPAAANSMDGFTIENGTLTRYSGTAANVVIPSNVFYIGDDVFADKVFIKAVTFPDNIVSIGARAFKGCTGLTSVTIPKYVKTISAEAFSGCTSLQTVTLNLYTEVISSGAFEDCPIKSITLPYTIKAIGMNAFKSTKITQVYIPSKTLQAIGDYAFDAKTTIKGKAGTRVETFAKRFGNPFIAVPDPDPYPTPEKLPALSLPEQKIRDTSTDIAPKAPIAASIPAPALIYYGQETRKAEAYYSPPVAADINGDGRQEILYASYSLYCADAVTGKIKWTIPTGHQLSEGSSVHSLGPVYCEIDVLDIDKDGSVEIVVGSAVTYDVNGKALSETNQTGLLAVYDKNGAYKPGFPVKLPHKVRGLETYDLNGDGKYEIIVTVDGNNGRNVVWVYNCYGKVMPGWPQLNDSTDATVNTSNTSTTGNQYGTFTNTIGIGDINGDGSPDIIIPSDTQFINAYNKDGTLIPASDIFTFRNAGRTWGGVGVWEDYEQEKKVENGGWGFGNVVYSSDYSSKTIANWEDIPWQKRNYASFTRSKAVVADVDGNGTNEVVVVGTISDKALLWPELPLYQVPFIFNGDRTRFKTDEYDWTTVPTNLGRVLSTDWLEIELCNPEPCVTDVNGDGMTDILYPSASGKVYCFSLDKKFSWSYWAANEELKEYASPLNVIDLNNDGKKEIVFTTMTAKNSGKVGSLVILDCNGNEIHRVQLPPSVSNKAIPNCGLAMPLVIDADKDGKYEIFVNGYLSGLTCYKLGGTASVNPGSSDKGKSGSTSGTPTAGKLAVAAPATIYVNNVPQKFECYRISGVTYFKLIDVGTALKDTSASFAINIEASGLNLVTQKAYNNTITPLNAAASGNKTATPNKRLIKVNGEAVNIESYFIGGSSYYLIGDLAKYLGFTAVRDPNKITEEEPTGAIHIHTPK